MTALDLLLPFFLLVLFATVGYAIGDARGRWALGFWLGLLLGPIGWILTALLAGPAQPENNDGPLVKCPECLGEVPALARKCRHCGSVLPWANPE